MAVGPRYKVEYKRRRKGKTDYKRRLNLLKSGIPRLVIRISNKHILAQLIKYNANGDRVLAFANSGELRKKFGWGFSMKNIPAAYLTGLLCGFRGKEKNLKSVILDVGLNPSVKGSRIYSAMKGVLDSGIEIPHNNEILPDDNRIKGRDISEYTKKEEIVKNFEESKRLIEKEFSEKIKGKRK